MEGVYDVLMLFESAQCMSLLGALQCLVCLVGLPFWESNTECTNHGNSLAHLLLQKTTKKVNEISV